MKIKTNYCRLAFGAFGAFGALTLSGCVAFPESVDALPRQTEIRETYNNNWAAIPPVRFAPGSDEIHINRVHEIPDEIAVRPIQYQFATDAKLAVLAYALSTQGVPTVIAGDGTLGQEVLKMPFYNGSLGDLMKALSVSQDIAYEYRNGVLLLQKTARYMVAVPQNKEIVERMVARLTGIGAADASGDIDSGLVSYSASPSHNEFINLYLQRAAKNAAMVTLQVAVIDVRLNRDRGHGFDWNEFALSAGSLVKLEADAIGKLFSMTGAGMGFRIGKEDFSVGAAIRALSKYGSARTDQDVMLSTLVGAPVKIDSGNEIPYVSDIGAVSSDGAVTGSATTSTVRSGLSVELVPYFDKKSGLVTTNIKVDLSSLVGFRELSAGTSLGTLSQPEIQELKFENITRVLPGEVIVLGGIAYDQVNDNLTSLPFVEKLPIGSKSMNTNRHAMFIILRPTITLFGEAPEKTDAVTLPVSATAISSPGTVRVTPETATVTTPPSPSITPTAPAPAPASPLPAVLLPSSVSVTTLPDLPVASVPATVASITAESPAVAPREKSESLGAAPHVDGPEHVFTVVDLVKSLVNLIKPPTERIQAPDLTPSVAPVTSFTGNMGP